MKRGHGQLFRKVFEPIAQPGDIVVLRTPDGLVSDGAETPFYVITHTEPAPLFGVKGTVVEWCATAAPAAPYQLDKAAVQGTNANVQIPSGSTVGCPVDMLTLVPKQFLQFRTLVRAVPDSNNAALTGAIDDYDLRWAIPQANARYGTQRLIAVINAMDQVTLPSDTTAAPARGSNLAATTNTQTDPFDYAARNELFAYGASTPGGQLNITNNGAAAASTGAIGIQTSGFLFNMFPVDPTDAMETTFLGYSCKIPPLVNRDDVIIIPVAPQPQPKS